MKTDFTSRQLVLVVIAIVYTFVVVTRLIGIDFGRHWDEQPKHPDRLERAVQNETLLPQEYLYPSFIFDFGMANLAYDYAKYQWSEDSTPKAGRRI